MKIKINAKSLKRELRMFGLSYSDMAEITGINVNRWKYLINSGGYITDNELQKILGVLQCDQGVILYPDFIIKQNTPIEIELLVQKLYERRKGDIQPVYEAILRNFRKTGKIENFIGEANRLLDSLFSGNHIQADLISALNVIAGDFQIDRNFSKSHAELDDQEISNIFLILQNSINNNSAQQAISIFLYVLVIFDVVFLEESIASVAQFTTERFGDKAEQYSQLTLKIEILRNTLLKSMIEDELNMDDVMVEEITEEVLEGIHLMLLACYKAGQHINGDYFSSEYVNRTTLDAIITRLNRIITNLGIQIPEPILGLSGTRFFNYLCIIRTMFQNNKTKQVNFTHLDAFICGVLSR
jgi:hypothetical protein